MHLILSIKRLTITGGTSVVVCTDLSGKESHRQVGKGRMVTLANLGGLMVSTMAGNARDMGSIPALCARFPIFITPTALSTHQ